jgi:DNA modification methylase
MQFDLFGNLVEKDELLRDKFIEPPFSILDTKSGNWQKRKRLWIRKGLKSEVGREVKGQKGTGQKNTIRINSQKYEDGFYTKEDVSKDLYISVFDPALCEVLYHWFCPPNGTILDPFAGGSVRGIVANYLGYKYTGIDIRQEQVDSNREQAINILALNNQPQWYVGDSNEILKDYDNKHPFFNCAEMFDMIFTCPPYADLEVYSDLEGDISNKPYDVFLSLYESIIEKSCKL